MFIRFSHTAEKNCMFLKAWSPFLSSSLDIPTLTLEGVNTANYSLPNSICWIGEQHTSTPLRYAGAFKNVLCPISRSGTIGLLLLHQGSVFALHLPTAFLKDTATRTAGSSCKLCLGLATHGLGWSRGHAAALVQHLASKENTLGWVLCFAHGAAWIWGEFWSVLSSHSPMTSQPLVNSTHNSEQRNTGSFRQQILPESILSEPLWIGLILRGTEAFPSFLHVILEASAYSDKYSPIMVNIVSCGLDL